MSALVSTRSNVILQSLPHPVWRADQIGTHPASVTSTGHRMLDDELPDRGWPSSALIELLLQQPGIGEMLLLRPALRMIARQRRIALVQPPHLPQIAAWTTWKLPPERLLWIRPKSGADALWAAEQILRNGSCGALLLWQTQVRPEALRRLHLAAQATETAFWTFRPLASQQDASPSPLRLAVRPAGDGVRIEIVKRRGPQRCEPLYLPLDGLPASPFPFPVPPHAFMDRHTPAAAAARNVPAALV
jgi:protein ImuA